MAKCDDDDEAYIDVPDEDAEEGMCGKLNNWIHGMRGAAHSQEKEYRSKFAGAGFIIGKSNPPVFRHSTRDLLCVVHGDDFTFAGPDDDLRWAIEQMTLWYEFKFEASSAQGPRISARSISWAVPANGATTVSCTVPT